MDYRKLFAQVRRTPEMFGVQNSFRGFCAFLHGVDAGNDWQLFIGFREFLVIRAGFGTNLTWPGLILRLSFPDVTSGLPDVLNDPEQERIAVDMLFTCLDEFLQRRAKHDETRRIFEEYFKVTRRDKPVPEEQLASIVQGF
jgi:hypothetical protein